MLCSMMKFSERVVPSVGFDGVCGTVKALCAVGTSTTVSYALGRRSLILQGCESPNLM